MRLLREDRPRRLDTLINSSIVLVFLLIAWASFAVLANTFDFLGRFKQPIYLFIIGAVLALVVAPLVRLLQQLVRKRWAAIASAYGLILVAFALLAVLLLNPFIQEARALASALRNPAASSLQRLNSTRIELETIQSNLTKQQRRVNSGHRLTAKTLQRTRSEIAAVQRVITGLSTSLPPRGQIQVPPSYVTPIQTPLSRFAAAYRAVPTTSAAAEVQPLAAAVADAKIASSAATSSYQKASSTPILLLSLQVWLDQHGINVDLHDKFGSALQTVSNQFASLLSNALNVALQAGNLFLNVILILLISIYFVADGARFVRWLVSLLPRDAQGEATYLVDRLAMVLGTYVRTLLLLAALAGALDATGAVVFGVPYPIVIFFSTFFLSLIPVVGSLVMYVPPMLIALAFTPLPRPIFYFIWLLVGEQLVTNVIGPRVTGESLGIHPLESMAAAFVGLPLAGLAGAILAVPITAFCHIVVREVRHGHRSREPAPQLETSLNPRRGGVPVRPAAGSESVVPPSADVEEEVPP